jgi:hypothetical protein
MRVFSSRPQRTLLLSALLALASALPSLADCPLALRSYEDVEKQGFVLEFDPPPPDSPAQQIAVARILHGARGVFLEFKVFALPGYGRVSMVSPDGAHSAYFFTEDLRATKTEVGSRILFIDGLGQADWTSGEIPGSREHPLGDKIWRLVGCKE